MSIVAHGVDLVDIARIERAVARFGQQFLRRVFTPDEIAYCVARRRPGPHLAARFAAKEAAMKALGTGRACGVRWRDIEVVRTGGPPQLRFHGAAARRFEALGAERALLTLTHARALALAHVVLLGR
jgi:holo-[acyl-carrier protein] synthase